MFDHKNKKTSRSNNRQTGSLKYIQQFSLSINESMSFVNKILLERVELELYLFSSWYSLFVNNINFVFLHILRKQNIHVLTNIADPSDALRT